MRDAARQALEAGRGLDRDDLERESLTTLGLIKLIEIIGEAARHVPPEVRSKMPELDWPGIVAMRNNLVHGYFSIDYDIVESSLRHAFLRCWRLSKTICS
ncbi:MAG: DUF86 domain-containing protein [Phycisphaeraceae bacterium]